MLRLTEIKLPLDHTDADLQQAICQRLAIDATQIRNFVIFKRGYDARKRSDIFLIYTVHVDVVDEAALLLRHQDNAHIVRAPDVRYHPVASAHAKPKAKRPVIVGFGPCGLFAALILAQMGYRPIVLERGKEVRERTKNTWDLWRKRQLHAESNVQFGEGGAGTFSDGKLWSQVSDPHHYGRKVLEEFVKAGAPEEIRYVSKPHIGTFRLVKMLENMRREIESLGGEIRFEQKVVGLQIDQGAIRGLQIASLADPAEISELACDQVILAIGHSARDTFEVLADAGVFMEPKPFSIGCRIEHPQSVIDQARFGRFAGHPMLGAADYKLVHHASNGRSVYSFCMCPGGTVVAATSEVGRVVTNGMSQYSRNERNANAGFVVGVSAKDFPILNGNSQLLSGVAFQRALESRAFEVGGGNYNAPAQRVEDFLKRRASKDLGPIAASYQPGVTACDLADVLPDYAVIAMREALPALERKLSGFSMPDAILTAVETRTSSPVRITRGKDMQSLNVRGLYPGGEGAGYAGGIMSAAIDGLELAQALALADPR
jgi:uncharacterized protein